MDGKHALKFKDKPKKVNRLALEVENKIFQQELKGRSKATHPTGNIFEIDSYGDVKMVDK